MDLISSLANQNLFHKNQISLFFDGTFGMMLADSPKTRYLENLANPEFELSLLAEPQ
jgi:hypothetical protein